MADGKPRPKLQCVWGRDVVKKEIQWLWKPFLQVGALNLITGEPGLGKSAVICELAAALTRGRSLPGHEGEPLPPSNVWIMNGEDNMDDTTMWRFDNQGGDPNRICLTDQALAITPAVAREMGEMIARHKFSMVVIDPIQAWMGGEVDAHRANETRAWANHIRKVASENGTAIVFVRHRRKGTQSDAHRIQSGMGSMDISGFARSELGFVKAKDGTRYITRIKGNVGPTDMCVAYDMERTENDHGRVVWGGLYEPNLGGSGGQGHSRVPKTVGLAKQWLRAFLKDGPRPSVEVFAQGALAGHSETTLKRAKDGVATAVQGGGGWVWQLIAEPRPDFGGEDGET